MRRFRIGFYSGAAADWGGASRVLFNTLKLLDRTRFEPFVLLPAEGPAVDMLSSLDIEHTIWGPVRETGCGLWRYGRDTLASMRLLLKRRVELLDVNFNYWRPAEVLAARMLGIPVVTHLHLAGDRPGPFVRWSSAVVAVSDYAARVVGNPGTRLEVVYNSVIPNRFQLAPDMREELGVRSDQVVVSFIGQVRENKGIDLFLRMAHRMQRPDVRFLIAGDCRDPVRFPGSYTVERLKAEMKGDPRIHYVGYRTDVEKVFAASDILVMPSRWGEPFGLINIEAGACAKPIVATRDGGIPEIIRHGENGFLIDIDDLDAMTTCVDRLVGDPQLRRKMGEAARERVLRDFVEQPVRKLERLYLELLKAS